jgi:uncharacterized protein (UPF0332 family)
MTHSENKVNWCLKKAEKEMEERGTHRGLAKIKPDKTVALKHIAKAEHNLKAAIDFAKIGYSDWSASAFFYSVYQCFLAISAKFGYESRNQECTFALIRNLVEDKQIDLDISLLNKIDSLEVQRPKEETTATEMREEYQYGTKLSIDEHLYEETLNIAQKVLSKAKEIIEE